MRKSLFWTLDSHPESTISIADLHEAAHQHAQLADTLGFECLWVGEHHFYNVGTIPNPAVLLGSLARVTQKIRLGPAVSVLPLRDSILIAEDYAMVDMISGGRLNMGVGTGSQLAEYQGMNIEFETRREEFERRLEKLTSYWSSPICAGEGSLNISPLQEPMPPIFIATTTPDRAYQAGMEGHSVLTIVSPAAEDVTTVQKVMDAHARGRSESEAPQSETEVVVTVLAYAAESEEEALSTAAVSVGRFLKAMSGKDVPDPEGLCRTMGERNTGLFGTARHIGEKLRQYRELGVEHVSFLANFGGMSVAQVAKSIRLLA
ncbi:MAG: LLM class flavin-dependent oxidoreductase, partial [Verrucomicrobia bacterium]|nr:LLM class flavin-dependent oxidoreductase [Verrucomicrobiota bacterium]